MAEAEDDEEEAAAECDYGVGRSETDESEKRERR